MFPPKICPYCGERNMIYYQGCYYDMWECENILSVYDSDIGVDVTEACDYNWKIPDWII